MSTAMVLASEARANALVPQNYGEVLQFAKTLSASPFAPKGMQTVEACASCVMMGMELGLTPMMALQSIAVINGRPSVWGDGLLAIIMAHDKFEDIDETFEGDAKSDDYAAICTVQRVGKKTAVTRRFSIADAKRAGLWNKEGPWRAYPQRMLQMRARAWAVRDCFPDVLRGLASAEEMHDVVSVSVEGEAPPPALTAQNHQSDQGGSDGGSAAPANDPQSPPGAAPTTQRAKAKATAEEVSKASEKGKLQEYLAEDAADAELADIFDEITELANLDLSLAELGTADEIWAMANALFEGRDLTERGQQLFEETVSRHLDRLKPEPEPEPEPEASPTDDVAQSSYKAGHLAGSKEGAKRTLPKAYAGLNKVYQEAYIRGFKDAEKEREAKAAEPPFEEEPDPGA